MRTQAPNTTAHPPANICTNATRSNLLVGIAVSFEQDNANPGYLRTNSGNLAIFAAILLASSFVSNLAADRRLIPCYKLIAYASDCKVARQSADADE